MASINQLFTTMISGGVKAVDGISNPKEKAMAYAELAKAIALTGLVSLESGEPSVPSREDLEEKPKAAKKAPKKPSAPVAEEEPQEAQEEEIMDPSLEAEEAEEAYDDEWTDEAIEKMPEEYEKLVEMFNEYEEESLNSVVSNFSNGAFTTIQDITPLNVTAFLKYVDMILNGSEEG